MVPAVPRSRSSCVTPGLLLLSLQSKLFRGDPRLEAAAASNSAHIKPGAVGTHVAKIQRALIALDGAELSEDGIYGPATATARFCRRVLHIHAWLA
jgi:hypothetical protein